MNTAKTLELLQSEAAYTRMCELYGAEKAEENIRRYGELVKKFRENFGENDILCSVHREERRSAETIPIIIMARYWQEALTWIVWELPPGMNPAG